MGSLLKDSFVHPEKIGRAKNLSKGKTFLYLLLLALIMMIPLSFQVSNILQNLHKDGQEIAANIPEFEIKDGTLTVPEKMKSYVQNTSTLSFFFDPNGDLDTTDVDRAVEQTSSFIGVAMLQKELYLNASLYYFSFDYTELASLTPAQVRSPFEAMGSFGGAGSVFFAVALYFFVFLNLLVELLLFTLFANIFGTFWGNRQRFGETWKIVAVASTLPTVFFALLELLGLTPLFQLEAKGLIIMILFFMATRPATSSPGN